MDPNVLKTSGNPASGAPITLLLWFSDRNGVLEKKNDINAKQKGSHKLCAIALHEIEAPTIETHLAAQPPSIDFSRPDGDSFQGPGRREAWKCVCF